MPSRHPKRPSGTTQPTRADDDLLLRKVQLLWPSASEQAQALTWLAGCPEPESTRVKLSVVKLSEGKLAEVKRYVEAARRDYRDVLLWAEYPNSAKVGPPAARPTAESRARQISARKLDAEQYQAWLKKG